MKKNILLISIFSLIISHSYAAVSFNLNTSTALGFTDSTHAIVIRGSLNGWAGNDWALTNVGGDYWTYTSDTLSDGTYEYKYVMINDTGDNWESTNNRALTVSGTTDLPQDYWESDTTPPYTETDTVDVWFRVSTAGIADYAGATMYIAGNMNGWSGVALAPEGRGLSSINCVIGCFHVSVTGASPFLLSIMTTSQNPLMKVNYPWNYR